MLEALHTYQFRRLRQLAIDPSLANAARSFNMAPITLLYSPDNRYIWCSTFTDVIKVSRDTGEFFILAKSERPGWMEDLNNGRCDGSRYR